MQVVATSPASCQVLRHCCSAQQVCVNNCCWNVSLLMLIKVNTCKLPVLQYCVARWSRLCLHTIVPAYTTSDIELVKYICGNYTVAADNAGFRLVFIVPYWPCVQADGVIMLPEQAKGPGIALPSPADKVCFMYLVDHSSTSSKQSSASQPSGGSPLDEPTRQLNLNGSAASSEQSCSLLVFCQVQMPERAMSWMQGLLQVVQAQHVLVVTSLPVSV